MSGVLRSLPDLAPTDVSRMIGTPRRVLASAPSVASNRSACLRAHSSVLGAYSPVSGMLLLSIAVVPFSPPEAAPVAASRCAHIRAEVGSVRECARTRRVDSGAQGRWTVALRDRATGGGYDMVHEYDADLRRLAGGTEHPLGRGRRAGEARGRSRRLPRLGRQGDLGRLLRDGAVEPPRGVRARLGGVQRIAGAGGRGRQAPVMSRRMPKEEAQVEATDDWREGAASDASTAPTPGGEHLTAGTIFAPGLVSEATTLPRSSAVTPLRVARERAAVGPDARGPAVG